MKTFKITNNKTNEINYFNANEEQLIDLMSLDKKGNFSFSLTQKYKIKPISDFGTIRCMVFKEHIDSMCPLSVDREIIPVDKNFFLDEISSGVVAEYKSPATTIAMSHTQCLTELKAIKELMESSELAVYYGRRNQVFFKNLKVVNGNYDSVTEVKFSVKDNNIIKTTTFLK